MALHNRRTSFYRTLICARIHAPFSKFSQPKSYLSDKRITVERVYIRTAHHPGNSDITIDNTDNSRKEVMITVLGESDTLTIPPSGLYNVEIQKKIHIYIYQRREEAYAETLAKETLDRPNQGRLGTFAGET